MGLENIANGQERNNFSLFPQFANLFSSHEENEVIEWDNAASKGKGETHQAMNPAKKDKDLWKKIQPGRNFAVGAVGGMLGNVMDGWVPDKFLGSDLSEKGIEKLSESTGQITAKYALNMGIDGPNADNTNVPRFGKEVAYSAVGGVLIDGLGASVCGSENTDPLVVGGTATVGETIGGMGEKKQPIAFGTSPNQSITTQQKQTKTERTRREQRQLRCSRSTRSSFRVKIPNFTVSAKTKSKKAEPQLRPGNQIQRSPTCGQ